MYLEKVRTPVQSNVNLSFFIQRAFKVFADHWHTNAHTWQPSTTQGAGLTVGSSLGFSVLLKDTSTCGQEELEREPTPPPEPQPPLYPPTGECCRISFPGATWKCDTEIHSGTNSTASRANKEKVGHGLVFQVAANITTSERATCVFLTATHEHRFVL